jgi:hypothetical protein
VDTALTYGPRAPACAHSFGPHSPPPSAHMHPYSSACACGETHRDVHRRRAVTAARKSAQIQKIVQLGPRRRAQRLLRIVQAVQDADKPFVAQGRVQGGQGGCEGAQCDDEWQGLWLRESAQMRRCRPGRAPVSSRACGAGVPHMSACARGACAEKSCWASPCAARKTLTSHLPHHHSPGFHGAARPPFRARTRPPSPPRVSARSPPPPRRAARQKWRRPGRLLTRTWWRWRSRPGSTCRWVAEGLEASGRAGVVRAPRAHVRTDVRTSLARRAEKARGNTGRGAGFLFCFRARR